MDPQCAFLPLTAHVHWLTFFAVFLSFIRMYEDHKQLVLLHKEHKHTEVVGSSHACAHAYAYSHMHTQTLVEQEKAVVHLQNNVDRVKEDLRAFEEHKLLLSKVTHTHTHTRTHTRALRTLLHC